MIECTVHLFSLKPDATPNQVISQLKAANQSVLLSGVPHGWIHKPHTNNVDQLLGSEWHLFVLTCTQARNRPVPFDRFVETLISINASIPEEQRKQLSQAASDRPPRSAQKLPSQWFKQNTGHLHIPCGQVTIETEHSPPAGTLRLDSSMANFLSTALPQPVSQKPVSLFNLFQYRNGDSAIHEQYMRDFKDSFGDSAGAFVKFMGPVTSQLQSSEEEQQQQRGTGSWQEANLTHYDSIYHYAYMLSTNVYRRLNKDKVRGLEDTCILLVSEVELESEEKG